MNSATTTEMVRPYMSYGKDERHIDKHIWKLQIPAFDPGDVGHAELVELSRTLSTLVAGLELDQELQFSALRRGIRQALERSEAGRRVAELVYELLS